DRAPAAHHCPTAPSRPFATVPGGQRVSLHRHPPPASGRSLRPPAAITSHLTLVTDREPLVRLQLALSLGESRHTRALATAVQMARNHGDEPWMVPAILTAVPGRGGALLGEFLRSPTNLNTHGSGSLFAAFDPEEAWRLVRRL